MLIPYDIITQAGEFDNGKSEVTLSVVLMQHYIKVEGFVMNIQKWLFQIASYFSLNDCEIYVLVKNCLKKYKLF